MQDLGGGGTASQWDGYADRLRARLPAAPEALLGGYVTWAPWAAIVFGALGILGALALLGIGAAFSPFLLSAGPGYLGVGFVAALVVGVIGALELAGGILMRQRRLTGWWLLAVGLIVSALNSLLSGALFSLILTLAIAYVHLQVKPRYS